ncbi:hypothetical protein [Myxacorys almedinensis]|nr:hypothetical protein [Myxacorys almedinensis]
MPLHHPSTLDPQLDPIEISSLLKQRSASFAPYQTEQRLASGI